METTTQIYPKVKVNLYVYSYSVSSHKFNYVRLDSDVITFYCYEDFNRRIRQFVREYCMCNYEFKSCYFCVKYVNPEDGVKWKRFFSFDEVKDIY